jgi:hypothetical protein
VFILEEDIFLKITAVPVLSMQGVLPVTIRLGSCCDVENIGAT